MNVLSDENFSAIVGKNVPYLRRYGRALTGSQTSGDRFAAATLEAIIVDMPALQSVDDPRAAVFQIFHRVWRAAGTPLSNPDTVLSARAQDHMASLTVNAREALLLSVIEGFTDQQIAWILDIADADVAPLIAVAVQEMQASVVGAVLVIEDEAVIAVDICDIVGSLGHRVTGIARTHTEAVALARKDPPDLVLADIQLADRSSGIDAVTEILQQYPQTPAIFITAFPERLLTGERPEPAFLITKPFSEDQLRSAVGQAMFFSSTETLSA